MPKDFVPPHFSYSSMSSWMQCGQQYYLQKMAHVPELPSWWLVGGSAVHAVTEQYDLENFPENGIDQLWQDTFNAGVEEQKTRFPDVSKWRTAGRKSKAKPDGEDYLAWMDLGPQFVRNYIEWRKLTQFKIWDEAVVGFDQDTGEVETTSGVELSLEFEIGGWMCRGSIDRVFYVPNSTDLIVVDIKTGSRMPDNDLQLGMYAVGMEVQYGERPKYGAFYNPRLNKMSDLFDMSPYTVDSLAQMGVQFKSAIKNKIFLPHKSVLCGYCSVSAGCAAVGGKDAHLYTIEKVLNA